MIPDDYLNRIVTGDARELSKRLPDESVDLVFTDPVYDRIDDYRWLAEEAARVLKPTGALLACFGKGMPRPVLEALDASLTYQWMLGVFEPNGPSRFMFHRGNGGCFVKQWHVLWYDRGGTSRQRKFFPDTLESIAGTGWAGNHEWRKNPAPFVQWLDAFTLPGALVFDPFTGGGTVPAVCKQLGRQYVAFEIDPATADRARERVRNTIPPLFLPEEAEAQLELAEMVA